MACSSSRPTKKVRLSTSKLYDNVPDIEAMRRKNDLRLKGRFQAIFDKYDCDFTGIGDEIDLVTGAIIVDNGHLSNMRHERDTGRSQRRNILTPSVRRQIEDEHDELSSPSTSSRLKQNPKPDCPRVFDPKILADSVATAFGANQQSFDPYDTMAVAELGKIIALEIAHHLQKPSATNDHINTDGSASPYNRHTMTPPISEPDFTSPRPIGSRDRKPGKLGRLRNSLPQRFESMWRGQEDNEFLVAEDPAPPERFESTWDEQEDTEPLIAEKTILLKSSAYNCPRGPIPAEITDEELDVPVCVQNQTKSVRGLDWTRDDNETLCRLRDIDELKWLEIVPHFPGRSLIAIRSHHRSLRQKGKLPALTIKVKQTQVIPERVALNPSLIHCREFRNHNVYPDCSNIETSAVGSRTPAKCSLTTIKTVEPRPKTASDDLNTRRKLVPPLVHKQAFLRVMVPVSASTSTGISLIKDHSLREKAGAVTTVDVITGSTLETSRMKGMENGNLRVKISDDLGSDDELG